MSSFLRELAHRLLDNYSNELSSVVVMLPSLRARTFFNDALARCSDRPVWQPRWSSVDELTEQISGLTQGERIRLISELYKVYIKYHPNEKFDKFYFWGEMLISDFDMIDKYLIDAKQLLRNLEEIKELETDVSYLTEEQERIIAFWRSIGDGDSISKQKQRFLKIWRSLYAIYTEFRERLSELGIGYTGMIYRTAAEKIKRGESIDIPKCRFVIAGFNALSESERVLFDYIARRPEGADFYWDYDKYYVDNEAHEAGMFLRNNIVRYPAEATLSNDCFTTLRKRFNVNACVSNVVQLKYVTNILSELPREELDKRTAIVLTDENMLIPLLHSLPEFVERVNVTMGYPLKTTLSYSFVERLIALQNHSRKSGDEELFYHVDVVGILSHPYITDCCADEARRLLSHISSNRITSVSSELFSGNELLSVIFSQVNDCESLSKYIIDICYSIIEPLYATDNGSANYLRVIVEEVGKTMRSIQNCDVPISIDVFSSLLRRHLQTVTIPYEGEPLEGIQIMGILETRNIDFKNVIILSMTDANFPGDRTGSSSFIPYNLRAAYGMPTPEQHEAMYAYYFYRLIQRAERVNMLYCSRADDRSTGERSRYIHQLEYESPYDIANSSVGVDLTLRETEPLVIEKGEQEMSVLNRYLDAGSGFSLSPTALFRYVECPMKFYFATVAHLKVRDTISDTIDALTFGNILHETMQELYTPFIGVKNPASAIAKLRNRDTIEKVVDRNMGRTLLGRSDVSLSDLSGDRQLVRDIITKYILRGIIPYDKEQEGFTIEGLEDGVECRYPISNGREVNLSGRADRIDRLSDGRLQIIDYKSGSTPHLEYNGMTSLFEGAAQERISNIFQTLLYSMMLYRSFGVESTPSLYYASQMILDGYSPYIVDKQRGATIERYSDISEEFEQELLRCLDELFDVHTPFCQAEDRNACTYCDYKKICRR